MDEREEYYSATSGSTNRGRSIRRGGWGLEEVFSSGSFRLSRQNNHVDEDEEALMWAALEKLPTYDRLRTGILKSFVDGDDIGDKKLLFKEVNVQKLEKRERQEFMDRFMKVAEADNEKFLRKFRERLDKVGMELPKVEVRFEHLTVEGDCYIGSRALPTLPNVAKNAVEAGLRLIGINFAETTKLTILKNLSGIIKPSRLTLLLGPPSSGKTTLLLALADKLDPSLKVKGEITYNGHMLNEFVPHKTSAYISQNDVHVAEMTVQETLDFSARCQGVGTRNELMRELARREKYAGIFPDAEIDLFMKATALEGSESSLITDYTLKILGLDICKDTIIGDQMRRGISGGQRKRVTTGEMIVGPKKTLFMDEISTGLDSSTTYQIVKCLQQIAHLTDATIFLSLLQPPPETFELFDDVVLLSEGHIVYQGPRENILEFFETCGFHCPERNGVADFLQEVTSRKDQEKYQTDRGRPYRYVTARELVDKFKIFHVGAHRQGELLVLFDKARSHKAALVYNKHSVSNKELFKACWDKEWLMIKRNSFFYVFKTTQLSIVAFIVSTMFLRTNMHTRNIQDGAVFLGALGYSMNTHMFNSAVETSLTISRLPVFYKHRDALFHPPWTFTLPNILLRLPISLMECIVWVGITYYSIGYALDAGRFFKQLLLFFLIQQMGNGLFRLNAAIYRSMTIAGTAGSVILFIYFLLGGLVIPRDRLPAGLRWCYWISPMSHGFSTLAINEMLAPRWMNKLAPDNSTRLGVAILKTTGVYPENRWLWIDAATILGFTVLFNVLFTLALMYLNPLTKPQIVLSKEVIQEMEMEGEQEEREDPGLTGRTSRALSSSDGNNTRRNLCSTLEPASAASPRRGMVFPFTPLAMSFDCVNYYVDMPREMKEHGVAKDKLQLLHEVTGVFRPGLLTSLMGVSGAGKTTLMDVLAGRKTGGYIEGEIKISGFPKRQETFARFSGYCEQNDIHSPQVTVRESLIFSAFLRLPKEVNDKEKMDFVNDVMELVELESIKDAIVGLPGVSGLSTEQRKRLTIAVELVANPSIIFMDEPTSGLDARAAAIVMRAVRNTVDTGRTVVCTIHQPSIDIFETFDELLLLKRGGQVIYAGQLGQNSHKLIEYFEGIPGVPNIKEKYNPATRMLEVSSTATEAQLGIDFAEHFKSSPLYRRNKDLIRELSKPAPGARDIYFPSHYSQSSWKQFKTCLWKQCLAYWRNPDYNLVRLFFTLCAAVVMGTVFWRVGTRREDSTDMSIVTGAMFSAVLFIGIGNCVTVMPVVTVERTVFYRERAAGMYAVLPYAIAQIAAEIPYVLAQSSYYTVIVYSMMSFQWRAAKFLWFYFVTFFTLLYFTYYGMMATSLAPTLHVADILGGSIYALFNLFAGFYIPRPRIPKWWAWYYWICPVSYTVYGLIISQYGDVEDTLKVPGLVPDPTIKWYIQHHYGFDPNFVVPVAVILVGFTVFFALMFAFGIRVINFQTR